MPDLPTLDEVTDAARRIAIARALELHGWQLRAAARALSITPGRLRRLIAELGLDSDYYERNPGVGKYERAKVTG